VLIRHGEDLTYCHVSRAPEWANLWFALDVAPRLPCKYHNFLD
jgi:hypothetical protein